MAVRGGWWEQNDDRIRSQEVKLYSGTTIKKKRKSVAFLLALFFRSQHSLCQTRQEGKKLRYT
jgi:hypothetical protein